MNTSYSRRQLYAFGETLGDSITRKEGSRIIFGDGGGGGGNTAQPSSTTQTTELPEWARGYAKDTLGKAAALTDVNQNPYQPYTADRIAGFSPMQQQAQQGAADMQGAPQMAAATGMASQAGLQALNTQYQGGQFQNQFQSPGQYDPAQVAMYQAQAPELKQYQMGPAQQVRTQSFAAPGSADAYMSPYMQNVVETQQREAQRTADIAGTQRNAQATSAGAFGGSRQAIMDAEAARNLATQKGDIQATGSQAAYQQAQGQFNAEQAARLQAQQANQQAGLTTGIQNLQARLGTQQFGAGQSLQAQLANQQALQSAQQLAEQSRQYGAGYGMTGAQTAAQYGQSAQQLAEQSRQYGAGLGLQAAQTGLQAAGQLGTLGQQQFGQAMDINKLQAGYGTQQQALQQQGLTQAYQDFQNQQNYPYKQLGFMSDMIRGLPLGQQSTSQMYEAAPSTAQQIGSIGMGAMGLSKFMAKGGAVKSYKIGGGIDSQENVADIVDSLSPQQLAKGLEAAQARGDANQIRAIQDEMGFQASLKRGLAGTVTPDMAQRMAGGGAVAFAKGGLQDYMDTLSEAGSKDISVSPEQRTQGIAAALPGVKALYGESKLAPFEKKLEAEVAANEAGTAASQAAPWFAGARGALKGRGVGIGAANALADFGEKVVEIDKEKIKANQLLRNAQMHLATAAQAREDGQIDKAQTNFDKAQSEKKEALDRKISVTEKQGTIAAGIEHAKIMAAATLGKMTYEERAAAAKLDAAVKADPSLLEDPAKYAAAKSKAFSDTSKETRTAASLPEKMEAAASVAAGKSTDAARKEALAHVDMQRYMDPTWKAAKAKNDTTAMAQREDELLTQRMRQASPAAGAPAATAPAAAQPTIKAGQVISGYQFKGGDPADKTNWVKV